MKRIVIRGIILFLGLVVVAGGVVYFFFPQTLLHATKKYYSWSAGVVEKEISIDGYPVTYYEGGKGETIVLIHGFGDSNISFLQLSKWLTRDYRVILPAVPGFGETPRRKKRKYSIHAQVKFFHIFFKKLKLKRFHLGGNSMGGHISAAYALSYPKTVKSLFLLNAAGLKTKAKLPYEPSSKPTESREDFYVYLRKVFYKVPSIPRPVESYLVKKAKSSFTWNNSLRKEIREGKDYILNKRIDKIKAPTLVVWGDSDRLVDISIGKLYKKKIHGAKWVLMKQCGHAPQYERPKETATILRSFLKSVK